MYQIRKRALSIVLLVAMILTLMPVSAAAAAKENGTAQTPPHILSTIKHEVDGDGTKTGQITAQIEAYLTDSTNKTRTVKPCDIIFLVEQSTFMNTQNNTAFYGQERKDILDTMEKMLDAIPTPTTGEHRVAISGYGRINNPGNSDTYVPNQYPGAKLDSSMNQSLNTGYYTCVDHAPVFHSANGWTEWSQVEDHDEKTTLPQMPNGYLADAAYEDVFMSVPDAKDVIDADKMVSWHAQASRMDAGLQLTERLAQIAKDKKDKKASGED